MIEKIKRIVIKIAEQKPEGFTVNPLSQMLSLRGYAVATHETQDCIGKKGLFKVIKFYLRHPGYCIGGWRNEEGVMQYDATMVFHDLDEAIRAASRQNQRAIFNLYTGRVIPSEDYGMYMK